MPYNAQTLGAATIGSFTIGMFTDTFSVSVSEADMVSLRLDAGVSYQVDVDNGAAGDLYLRLFDPLGLEVRANDDGSYGSDDVVFGLSPYLRFTPNYTGLYTFAISPYYLDAYDPGTTAGRASGENPLATTAGTLTVTNFGASGWGSASAINAILAESPTNDKSDDLRDEDRSLRVSFAGFLDSLSDVDMVRIDLIKGDAVVIDVNGLGGLGTVLRVFTDAGTPIGFDDDSGVGEDPELTFFAPATDDYYIGISGEGNGTYNALDGSGTVSAAATGAFEVIIHRNPTQIGSGLANSFAGSEANNYIVALAGNDTVSGGLGEDTLAGGDDQDSLNGGDGRDVLYGEQGADTLDGGRGSDVVIGGLGDDRVSGGTTTANDLLEGNAGNDTLLDGNGADTLSGGDGNDSMNGGAQNNLLDGGNGNDTLIAGPGADTMLGGAGNDSLNAADGANRLDGGGGADTIRGGAVADTLIGGIGNDNLTGLDGADTIAGGDDADTLNGGLGNDTLSGDAGNDSLLGGAGADIFDFNAIAEQTDIIGDFRPGTDRIDLVGIVGAGVVNAGNLAQFIQVSVAGISDTFLGVDANGPTGGIAFSIIAQVNGLTPAQLFDINNYVL
jgi:Ca2+-binding RTX toxin-like protein